MSMIYKTSGYMHDKCSFVVDYDVVRVSA